ncbi:carboxypeptidase-like regulatory domain-containing protein [Terriglobus albidus]|nr:carboxypeptidase-like regulatory domain-containing protein [Terriglobus albidus]
MFAQTSTANVTGTVVDVTTARIPDANVKLLNILTGAESNSRTNHFGMFFLPGVIPGDYTLEIDRSGFAAIQITGLTLHVGDTKNFLIRMPVGPVAQTVDVNQSEASFDTGNISVGTVVDRGFVANMPLNGRSFQDLIAMTPGVTTQSPQTTGESFGARGSFSVNGQRIDGNGYFVDGVSANVGAGLLTGHQKIPSDGSLAALTALGTTQSLVAVDALQEFRVMTSTYPPEYGRLPGGQFTFLTHSGTNTAHGSLFNYVRTDAADATDWYTSFNKADRRTAYHQDDFGGTLGVPIILPGIYRGIDKTFIFLSYEGLNVRQPSAPQVQFVPDVTLHGDALPLQAVLNLFPQVNHAFSLPSAISTGLAPYPGGATSYPGIVNATSVRLDHTLSSKLSGFLRYGETPSRSEAGNLSSLTQVHADTRTFTLGATAQLASRINNELRIGYAASHSSLTTTLDNYYYSLDLNFGTRLNPLIGIPPSSESASAAVFIQIPGAGPSEIKTDRASSALRQWNIRDTFNAQAGRRLLRFGIDQRQIVSTIKPPALSIEADFFSTDSLLQNRASAISITRSVPATPIFQQFAAFLQDQWRVSQSFTITSGLRWEASPPPHGKNGLDAYTLLGDIADPSRLTLAPRGTPLWHTAKFNIAPSVGGVWALKSTPGGELLIRAGAGIFFATANRPAAEAFSALGFSATNHPINVPVPVTPAQLDFSATPPGPYINTAAFAFPPHLQLPYALQWNIGIEKSLGKRQTLNISWVGTNGRRLLQKQRTNISSENPMFGEVYFFPGHLTSSYQALQIKFQRAISHGLQVLGNYGWSHTLDYGSTDPAFPLTRGNSDLDVRQNFQTALSWDENLRPGGKMSQALIGGWGVDARLAIRTAFPIQPLGNIFSDPASGNRYYSGVDLIPGRQLYLYGTQYPGGRMINGGPNVAAPAFALPDGARGGTAPRNLLRGFGAYQTNLALRREFALRTKAKLQVRLDAFNIFNHPEFGYIDPTLTDTLFGQATLMLNQSFGSTGSLYEPGGPRSLQISLRLHF